MSYKQMRLFEIYSQLYFGLKNRLWKEILNLP